MTISNIFQIYDNIDIDLLFAMSMLATYLNIGTTLTILRVLGNLFSGINVLIIKMTGVYKNV